MERWKEKMKMKMKMKEEIKVSTANRAERFPEALP